MRFEAGRDSLKYGKAGVERGERDVWAQQPTTVLRGDCLRDKENRGREREREREAGRQQLGRAGGRDCLGIWAFPTGREGCRGGSRRGTTWGGHVSAYREGGRVGGLKGKEESRMDRWVVRRGSGGVERMFSTDWELLSLGGSAVRCVAGPG